MTGPQLPDLHMHVNTEKSHGHPQSPPGHDQQRESLFPSPLVYRDYAPEGEARNIFNVLATV